MAAEESDSASSVMALEHGLAEAQEANNIHRELELLERLGDELGKIGKKREAEGFYHRFLALAKQLRTAEHIQRGHTKLARFHSYILFYFYKFQGVQSSGRLESLWGTCPLRFDAGQGTTGHEGPNSHAPPHWRSRNGKVDYVQFWQFCLGMTSRWPSMP